jgi:conjugative transfer signal peptidase TraF
MNGRHSTILTSLVAIACLVSTIGGATPRYVWNASSSVPVGLYQIEPAGKLTITQLVAVQPPDPLAAFLDLNGYLPSGLPMLKRVVALPGQIVCRIGLIITVDNFEIGQAHERDGQNRPLPVWQGCRVIGEDEIFIMNWQSADSLDSRYFGPLSASAVIGRALPVWTDEE